jgi:hypothetical protein
MQSRSSYVIASDAPLAYLFIQLHHTGLQEKVQVAVPEEHAGADPQEIQTQEVSEEESKERTCPSAWIVNLVPLSEASTGAF